MGATLFLLTLSLNLGLTSCFWGATSESAAAEYGLGGSASLMVDPSSRGAGLFEVALYLDGKKISERNYSPAYSGLSILQVPPDYPIGRGNHRLTLRVLRQQSSTTTYLAQMSFVVIQLNPVKSWQYSLPGQPIAKTFAAGDSITLTFAVGE